MAAGGLLEAEGITRADMTVLKAITVPLSRRSAAQRRSTRAVAPGKFEFHAALAEFGRDVNCAGCALMCLFRGQHGPSPL